jgi:hypothetical protein
MAEGSGVAMGVRYAGDGLPGLVTNQLRDDLPRVQVSRVAQVELDERWAGTSQSRTLFEIQFSSGKPFLRIEAHDALGYRVWAHGFGLHLVAAGGTALACALPEGPPWVARRLLASQVFPLIAALHGREPLHASATVVEGRLVALAAPSGTGKSSTACHLIVQGAAFFADDVLALEIDAGRVLAHPGPRMTNVADRELARLTAEQAARLGRPLGTGTGRYLEPHGHPEPRALDALLILERTPGGRAGVEPLSNAGASLLSHAAIPYLDRPERLLHQLDIAAALAANVTLARITVGADEDAQRVARRIGAWAQTL